jgi:hypothetical protein
MQFLGRNDSKDGMAMKAFYNPRRILGIFELERGKFKLLIVAFWTNCKWVVSYVIFHKFLLAMCIGK